MRVAYATCGVCGRRGPCRLSMAPMRCLCDDCHEALLGDGPVTPIGGER